ncbi:hypothetical protein ACLOJK_028486 [Asimina triloba]
MQKRWSSPSLLMLLPADLDRMIAAVEWMMQLWNGRWRSGGAGSGVGQWAARAAAVAGAGSDGGSVLAHGIVVVHVGCWLDGWLVVDGGR